MIQDSIGFLLAAATRLSTKEFNKTLRQYGITAPQWSVLNFIGEQGGYPQTQIGEMLHWDKATIGDIVENLIKKGLAERTVSEQDRRAYCVYITSDGADLIRSVLSFESEINNLACDGMSDQERELLTLLLRRIIYNLKHETDKCPDYETIGMDKSGLDFDDRRFFSQKRSSAAT